MKNELTLKEVRHIKTLEGMGYNINELAGAIVFGRSNETYVDIKAQIERLLK